MGLLSWLSISFSKGTYVPHNAGGKIKHSGGGYKKGTYKPPKKGK